VNGSNGDENSEIFAKRLSLFLVVYSIQSIYFPFFTDKYDPSKDY
jgi:hypothetical protein